MDDTRNPLLLTGEIRNSALTAYHPSPGDLLRVEEVGERGEISVMPVSERETIVTLRRAILRLEDDRDAAMQSARLAQEAVERFVVAGEKVRAALAADRRAVMDALGGGITDASLKERILALRAERDEYRAELATILAERDAAVSMGTQLERELVERTEELEKTRKALARAVETLDAIGEPVVGGEPRATLAVCEHIARDCLVAIRPFLGVS